MIIPAIFGFSWKIKLNLLSNTNGDHIPNKDKNVINTYKSNLHEMPYLDLSLSNNVLKNNNKEPDKNEINPITV